MCTRPRRSARGKLSGKALNLLCVFFALANDQHHSLDYLFQLAVEMKKLGIPWVSDIPRVAADRA